MRSLWLLALEPLLRWWPGFPPDWERRRTVVFERATGRCESCGVPAGRFACVGGVWRVTGAHVHHVVPIARGGRHAPENLRLFCVTCHQAEHPENLKLGRAQDRR